MSTGGRTILPSKKAGETVSLIFDFISSLPFSETISTAVVTASVYSGVDASPSAVISGSATITGSQAAQKVTAGVAGCIYTLLCTITTSGGLTIQMSGLLAIEMDASP